MDYYIMEQDMDYTDCPVVMNWFGKIDTENIKQGRYENLKKRYVLPSRGSYDTDIITKPFLAVSPMVFYCIKAYEPAVEGTAIYLLDKKAGSAAEYFIPYLDEVNCLARESKVNINKTVIEKAVLDFNLIEKDRYIFNIGGLNSRYTIARCELIESILKRGARGIRFLPVENAKNW